MLGSVDGYSSALDRQITVERELELADFVSGNVTSVGFFIVPSCFKAYKIVIDVFVGPQSYS